MTEQLKPSEDAITMDEYKSKLANKMSHAELDDFILECAHTYGWVCAHFHAAIVKSEGVESWATPVSADGKGFPDWVMAHPYKHRLITVEVKTQKDKLSAEQEYWEDILTQAHNEHYLWRPKDWLEGIIERILR